MQCGHGCGHGGCISWHPAGLSVIFALLSAASIAFPCHGMYVLYRRVSNGYIPSYGIHSYCTVQYSIPPHHILQHTYMQSILSLTLSPYPLTHTPVHQSSQLQYSTYLLRNAIASPSPTYCTVLPYSYSPTKPTSAPLHPLPPQHSLARTSSSPISSLPQVPMGFHRPRKMGNLHRFVSYFRFSRFFRRLDVFALPCAPCRAGLCCAVWGGGVSR